MLSIIIPSRNVPEWPYTQKTIDDLFEKATGEIEVIVILDGYLPNPPIKERKNLIIVHNPESEGMRNAINKGVSISHGKYILKCDDHCLFGEGYDEILSSDCEDNWLVVPSRYALNGAAWLENKITMKELTKFGPLSYLTIQYPFNLSRFGHGLHGIKWEGLHGQGEGYFYLEKQRKDILIDDMLMCQGSCWFTTKKHYLNVDGMELEYLDWQESSELVFKTWLSGGRCVVNKRTFYAHLHKGSMGRGYKVLRHHQIKSNIYSCDLWLNNRWSKQIYKFEWLIDKFGPLDGWESNDWKDPNFLKNYDYSKWYQR